MNKKIFAGLFTTAALGAIIVAPTSNAATPTKMETSAGIGFFEINGPGPGPFSGNLAMAYAPLNFDFGNNDSTGLSGTKVSKTYYQDIDPSATQYVAVSDDRPDKTKNWTLNANLDTFKDVTNDANTLASAELSFKVGKQQRYNINITDSDKFGYASPIITTAGAVTDFTGGEEAYYNGSATSVTLEAGSTDAKPILKYTSPGQAITNTLAVASTISEVKLNVKDHTNVKDKKFKSTVHWNLSVTP